MTQDEIIEIARRVGFPIQHPDWQKAVEEFAALVEERATAIEREACAKVCEQSEIPIPIDVWHGGTKKEMTKHTALALANAIRARGQV